MSAWYLLGLNNISVEVMPGILAGFIPYLVQIILCKGNKLYIDYV